MTGAQAPGTVDLATCAAEPIHIIGRIQSFGYLVSFSSDWLINHLSRNCADLFGAEPERLVGTSAESLLARGALHEVRSRLQVLGKAGVVDRIFAVDLVGDGRLFDLAVHVSGRSFVLEAEPAAKQGQQDSMGQVRPMVDRLRGAGTVEDLCRLAARQLRGLTGFDRVMVYRFAPDGAGQVVAESLRGGVDSFLGLHFPASDIPAQARRLYARNMLRIIADVRDPTVPVIPAANPDGEPLDLSMSGLRAVSPIHIEYLRNMGVEASMSVSIMRGGALWGLMACHHHAPLQLDYTVRTAAELFGEFFSFILEQVEAREVRERGALALKLHDEIMGSVAAGASVLEAFEGFADSIGKVIPYDAVAGWIGGRLVGRGRIPEDALFAALARFLNTTASGRVWHSDNLAAVYPPAADFGEIGAGILVLPVSRAPRDFIMLFRREQPRTVNWAGNPAKAVEHGPNGSRLTPRKSFDLWQEEHRGFSAPWTTEEVAIADSLRVTLLEVVLRMSDAAQADREEASRRQEVLIAELNHRVRNLLNLVKGLVVQSRAGTDSIADFAQVLSDRIHALSRAHDLVTTRNWAPASLGALIEAEGLAYVGERAERVRVSGCDVLLQPGAFTTLALVFHELMTNSCKYGALSLPGGQVSVAVARDASGGAEIVWQERGGPAVVPPTRRGFGSSIIQHSIPHELGGRTELDFAPDGLTASMTVPAAHIASFASLTGTGKPAAEEALAADGGILPGGAALVVEDKMIIAMEAEAMLLALGAAECRTAGSLSSALAALEAGPVDFALLDVNLGGGESSEPVAARLRELGVPFVVASGYDDGGAAGPALDGAPLITKPYTQSELRVAVATALRRGR